MKSVDELLKSLDFDKLSFDEVCEIEEIVTPGWGSQKCCG